MEYLCKLITNPDWWIVLFTAISTIAVIVIAIVQSRIQRQQIKVQEYEIYRKLYHSIKQSNAIIDSFVFDVLDTIWPPSYHQADIDKLKQRQRDILSLHKELENNIIDFDLKFSTDFFDKNKYYAIFHVMIIILDDLIYLYNQNDDYWLSRNIKEEYHKEIKAIRDSKDEGAIIKIILEHIHEIGHKTLNKLGFESFVELKSEIDDDCIIDEIRNRCTTD